MNEFFPLASAAGMTVGLAVCALIVGLALAMFFAVWESAKWRPVAWAGSALVTILRGLPEILVVLFTTPYYDNSALFVGQQGKYTSVDQLKGKKVGVQNGTTHQKFIMDKHPEITTVPYDSYQNAKLDLQNGRIDGVFGDTAVVTEWLKDNPKLAAVGDKVTDKDYFGTGLGIAVRQGNTELQQKLNTALEKVKKDGTYETIYNKWFQK